MEETTLQTLELEILKRPEVAFSEIRSSLTPPKVIRLLFHIHANRNDGNCGGT